MAWIGHAAAGLVARLRLARGAGPLVDGALGVATAAAGILWLAGFTVDDALIAVRYARHIAAGVGYRFNVGQVPSDGVTPLPWPWLLAPLARAPAGVVLERARAVGVVATLVTGALVGRMLALTAAIHGGASRGRRVVSLGVALLALPVAAYAASGMETPLAMLFATVAAVAHLRHRPRQAAAAAGLAVALRPELGAWAWTWLLVGALGEQDAAAPDRRVRAACERLLIASAPLTLCVSLRIAWFGRAGPLALLAKPSDVTHGASYAVAAALASAAPLLVAGWRPMTPRTPPGALAVACLAHAVTVALVGGDWMPFARLYAPIVPATALAFAGAPPARWGTPLRGGLALLAVAHGLFVTGPRGRSVLADRRALAAVAAPLLRNASVIATVDVGWPTLVTDAPLVDLAGLTDPAIAALPGGHTSKRVSGALLRDRGVDMLLVYVVPGTSGPVVWRGAEERLLADPEVQAHYGDVAFLPLGAGGAGYRVLSIAAEGNAGETTKPPDAAAPEGSSL